MLEVLLHKIPNILFEPIAIGSLFGLATAVFFQRRNKSAIYWVTAFALFFMIGWRLAIQIISSRYASILIFPAIIAMAYFAFKLEIITSYIPKFPKILQSSLPYLTIIGLSIAGLAQLLHYNPYATRILKIVNWIKSDARQFRKSYILSQDSQRLHYYSGISAKKITSCDPLAQKYSYYISRTLQDGFDENTEAVYVVVQEAARSTPGTSLQKVPDIIRKETVLLKDFYLSRNRKKITRLYRCKWKNVVTQTLRPYVAQEVTKNAHKISFFKIITEDSVSYKSELSFFATRKNCLQKPILKNLPLGWSVSWCPGFDLGSNGELGITALSDGNNAFRLKSNKTISAFYKKFYPAKKWRIRMKITGVPGAKFSIGVHTYDSKYIWCDTRPQLSMILPAAGIWEYTTDLHWISEKEAFFRIIIYLFNGEIFVHSINLEPNE